MEMGCASQGHMLLARLGALTLLVAVVAVTPVVRWSVHAGLLDTDPPAETAAARRGRRVATSSMQAMQATGLSGYRNDTEFSLGRQLRDVRPCQRQHLSASC